MLRNAAPMLRSSQHCSSAINSVQIRTSFYNKYRHGPTKLSNPSKPYLKWLRDFFGRDGVEFIKAESTRIYKKAFRTTISKPIELNKPVIIEHFDSDESIKRWKPVADSDSFNGFSVSNLSRSKAGHALFSGVLDTRVPDDGLTQNSGFTAIIGPQAPRDNLTDLETHWNWGRFNCVEIRFRGDGRKYSFVLNTSIYQDDLTYYDTHGYPLYTRGGPYWQTYRIPFSKLIFAHKGLIQDVQGPLPFKHIKFIAFALQDTVDGPFALEIDYVALLHSTEPFFEYSSYELYAFPHIRYKPLSIGCDPPEPDYN